MRILVTGGLGFIGSHLVDGLSNHTIDVVDSCVNQRVDEDNLNIDTLYKQDIRDFQPEHDYDQIYHLASPVGPAGVLNYAGQMAPNIIGGLRKVLDIADEQKSKILYVSSSEVYGPQPDGKPQVENVPKIVPDKITVRLEYGVGKLLGEIMARNDVRDKDYDLHIVRFFNTIGERQNPKYGFVVPRFINQALTGKDITVFGDGEQRRAFTYVKDTVDAMKHIMEHGDTGEIYNIGSPYNETSILNLAETIKRLTDSDSEIAHIDPKTIYGPTFEEAWNKLPNIDKLESIGWEPKYSLEEALNRIIEETKEREGY